MTRLTSCVALGFFAATVGLCQSPPASAAEPDSVELTMSRLLVANNDVAAFAEFMAEDATMFFPPSAPGAPSLRVQGKTEIARAFAEMYARLGSTKTAISSLLIRISDSTSLAPGTCRHRIFSTTLAIL